MYMISGNHLVLLSFLTDATLDTVQLGIYNSLQFGIFVVPVYRFVAHARNKLLI